MINFGCFHCFSMSLALYNNQRNMSLLAASLEGGMALPAFPVTAASLVVSLAISSFS